MLIVISLMKEKVLLFYYLCMGRRQSGAVEGIRVQAQVGGEFGLKCPMPGI